MALSPEQKAFESKRAKTLVTTLFEAGPGSNWTAQALADAVTDALGTDGSSQSDGDNAAAAGWIIDGLVKSKAMVQQDDGSAVLTEEAVFQYKNKSNFFSTKTPIGMIKVRQGAVVTVI